MSKIKKYGLSHLVKTMQTLNDVEKSMFVGGDIIYMDSKGSIVGVTEDSNSYDTIVIGNTYYTCSGHVTTTIENDISWSDTDSQQTVYGSRLELQGGDYGLFQFLADNTSVEWQGFYNGGEDVDSATLCMLRTIHSSNQVTGSIPTGYNSTIHSHVYGSSSMSEGDEEAAEAYGDFGYSTFAVYDKQTGRTSYNDI